MKKNFNSRVLLVICFIATFALGCGGDDPATTASCDNDVSAFEAALTAYINDIENVSKCNALKSAANEVLDCPGITAAQRAEYEDSVDGLVCD